MTEKNLKLLIPPPAYALALLALCKFIDGWLGWPRLFHLPLVGAVLALAALGLMFWAWQHFLAHKTTPMPTGKPSALVSSGPYRFTRNPMYLGIVFLLVAAVFYTGSPVYLFSVVGFYWIADRWFIPHEESKLESLFGTEFDRFKSGIKRWW